MTRRPLLGWLAPLLLLANAAIVAVYLASLTGPTGADGEGVVGDYAAFWTGARLVADGRGADLYDPAAQRATQAEVLGRPLGERWQPYLNPPALAIGVSLTAPLGFVRSFWLWDLVGLGVLVGGAAIARPALRRALPADRDAGLALVVVLACPAVLRPLAGGQNLAYSLGLLCAAYGGLATGRDALAGIAIGLLSYKPQYGLPLWLALLVWRRWGAAGVAAGVAVAHYALAAAVCGPGWPVAWLRAVRLNESADRVWNGPWHFSWPAVIAYEWPAAAPVLAPVGVLAVLAGCAFVLWNAAPGTQRFPAAFGAAVAGAMISSTHLWYYEVGLLALPIVLALETRAAPPGLGVRAALAAVFFGTGIYELGPSIHFQPLFLLLAGTLWACASAAGTGARRLS